MELFEAVSKFIGFFELMLILAAAIGLPAVVGLILAKTIVEARRARKFTARRPRTPWSAQLL